MTITVEIKPEIQVELARQAVAQGRVFEAHVAMLLEDAVHLRAGATQSNLRSPEDTLREMAQFSHKIPALPDEAFSRENLYQDHG